MPIALDGSWQPQPSCWLASPRRSGQSFSPMTTVGLLHEKTLQLSTNEQTRKEKTNAVETLHAEIDQLESSIAKLTEDITDLTKAPR